MRDLCLLRVIIPPALPTDQPPEALFENMLINAAKELGGSEMSLECVGYGQYMNLLIGVSKKKRAIMESILFASYPDADIQMVEDYVQAVNPKTMHVAAARVVLKNTDTYPIITYENREQANVPSLTPGTAAAPYDKTAIKISQLFTAFSTVHQHDQLWMQMIIKFLPNNTWFHFRRESRMALSRTMRQFNVRDYLRPSGKGKLEEVKEQRAKEKGDMLPLHVTIRCLCVSATSNEDARQHLEALLGNMKQFNHIDLNELIPKHVKQTGTFLSEYRRRSLTKPYFFTPREAATLIFVPDPAVMPNVVHVQSRKLSPPPTLPDAVQRDSFPIGYTNYHNVSLPFGMKIQDRRRNIHVIGESGVGKEQFLQRMIVNDIERGYGVSVVDPHGTIIDGVLPFIPRERLKDVLFLDLADERCPISFNPLERLSQAQQSQFVRALVRICQRIIGTSWNPETEQLLNYTFSALLGSEGTTLFSAISLYKDPAARKQIAEGVHDALTKNFWLADFERWSELSPSSAAISGVLNKLGQLLSAPVLRRVLGHPKSSFDIENVVESRKIILWSVPKGLVGEEASMLLGSLFTARLGLSVAERVHTNNRNEDYFVYVEDFPSFELQDLQEIFTAARQYPLNFVLAHQRMTELDDEMRKAIIGNVGNVVSFRIAKGEAEKLLPEFDPLTEGDFVNLPNNNFYISMEIDGKRYPPFSGCAMGLPEKARVRREDISEATVRNSPPTPPVQQVPYTLGPLGNPSEEKEKSSRPERGVNIDPATKRVRAVVGSRHARSVR